MPEVTQVAPPAPAVTGASDRGDALFKYGVLSGAVATGVLLLAIGLDGDDYYFLTLVRRLSPAEFSTLVWPANGLTFRVWRLASLWALSWLAPSPAPVLRFLGAALAVPTVCAIYGVNARLLPSRKAAVGVTVLTVFSATFPFPWSYAHNAWDYFMFFVCLWLWLRWWERPNLVRLSLTVAVHSVGLLTYEFQLVLAPVACCALVMMEGDRFVRRLRGRRAAGLLFCILPLVAYVVLRFGVSGVSHYYSSYEASQFGGGPWGRAADFPLAYAGTAGTLWRDAVTFGLPGWWGYAAGFAGAVLLLPAVVRGLPHAFRTRTRQSAAAGGIAALTVVPFTGLTYLVYQVFTGWGLWLFVVSVYEGGAERARGRRATLAVIGGIALVSSVWRCGPYLERAAFQRQFTREVRRAVASADGSTRLLIRGLPESVARRPWATTLDSVGQAVLPWPQSSVCRFSSWSDRVVPNVRFWLLHTLTPQRAFSEHLRLLVWSEGRLRADPLAARVLPTAAVPLDWMDGAEPGLKAWRGDLVTRRLPDRSAAWQSDSQVLTVRGPKMPPRPTRFRAVYLRLKIQAANANGHAQVHVSADVPVESVGTLRPTLTCWVPTDDVWHDVWMPVEANPHFGMFAPVERLHLRVEGQTGMRLTLGRVTLLP